MSNIIQNNSNLICETRVFNLSTQSSCGTILNSNTDYKSKMFYDLGDTISQDDSVEYIQFSIPYAVIPCSFFNINYTNNTLVVLQNGITTTYSFTEGAYNATTFISLFTSIMGTGWSISLNTSTYKYTISHSTYSFTFLKNSSIDYVLGFSGNTSSTGLSLALSRVCNFLPIPRVIMRCPELSTNNGVMVSRTNNSHDVILSIPNISKLGSQIVYNSDVKNILTADRIRTLTISFTDENYNYLDFNGVSSYFTIRFDIYRRYLEKPPNFFNLVSYVNKQSAYQDYLDTLNENQQQ